MVSLSHSFCQNIYEIGWFITEKEQLVCIGLLSDEGCMIPSSSVLYVINNAWWIEKCYVAACFTRIFNNVTY